MILMDKKITVISIIAILLVATVGYLYNERSNLTTRIQEKITENSQLQTQIETLTNQIEEYLSQIDELLEENEDLTNQIAELTDTIQIGVLCNDPKVLSLMHHVVWIAEDEINQYCVDNGLQYRFEFVIESTDGQMAIALEKVQGFKALGIELVVAYLGSEYSAIYSYIADNDMAFIDAVNTMPEYALPDDGLYRMRPMWELQGYALAEDMWSWGNEAVIVLRQDNQYMDQIYDVFKTRYEAKGGVIYGESYLPGPEITEYSNFLTWLESSIDAASVLYGDCNVGVQLFTYYDISSLFPYLLDYPGSIDLTWFGNEALANAPTLFMYNPTIPDMVKLMSPTPAIATDTTFYQDFASIYTSTYGSGPSFEACLIYDSCWVMAKSVIAAGSNEGEDVNPVVIPTSNAFTGTTGRCTLDSNGDRAQMDYDVWGYSIEPTGFISVKYGYYTGLTDTTTWYIGTPGPCCWIEGSGILFDADFSGDTVGSEPSPSSPLYYGPAGADLDISADSYAAIVVDSTELGSKALEMQRGSTATTVTAIVGDDGNMPYTSGDIIIQFRAVCTEYSSQSTSTMLITVGSESGDEALRMTFYNGEYRVIQGGSGVLLTGSYDSTTAHSVRIKLDMDTGWYWICIDGEVLANGAFESGGFTELHHLEFRFNPAILEAFQTVYVVDDIQISK